MSAVASAFCFVCSGSDFNEVTSRQYRSNDSACLCSAAANNWLYFSFSSSPNLSNLSRSWSNSCRFSSNSCCNYFRSATIFFWVLSYSPMIVSICLSLKIVSSLLATYFFCRLFLVRRSLNILPHRLTRLMARASLSPSLLSLCSTSSRNIDVAKSWFWRDCAILCIGRVASAVSSKHAIYCSWLCSNYL